MDRTVCIELMLICGCLHDIAEKSKELYTPAQINRVEERLMILMGKYFSELIK